jgi:hypothetical protein
MTGHREDDRFDHAMRELHRESLAHLHPDTLRRLRAARTAAGTAPPRRFGWPVAGATAALLVVAVALPALRLATESAPAERGTSTAPPSAASTGPATPPGVAPGADDVPAMLAALEESPDFYLWLASNDLGPTALE